MLLIGKPVSTLSGSTLGGEVIEMNLFSHIEKHIFAAIEKLKADGELSADAVIAGVTIEPPREASHGDVATNAALVLAKSAGKKPRELASKIAEVLKGVDEIESVEIAGPGFINLTLSRDFWLEVVSSILTEGRDYGRSHLGDGRRVNIEYVSVNPTGPLHVGHCRGAIFGDALASLLEFCGFDVTREYYVNDAGSQVDILARSAYLRYREALGEDIGEIPEGLYPGDYLKAVGEALAQKHKDKLLSMDEAEWLPIVRDSAISDMMDVIRQDLASVKIEHEVFFSERSLISDGEDKVAETIDWLEGKGLIYEGRLPPPKGKLPDDWEDRVQTLFRATDFGDDVDRALKKSDGGYTYFAADMAYHRDKISRGFKDMINVWGADHGGYIKRIQAAVKALSNGEAVLDVKICQLVNLFRAGEPVKMSKRAGNFITLREMVAEVGADPVRFMMLYRKNDAPLEFDFAKVVEQSKDNPVFYVQYAHARCYSIFRNANKVFPKINLDGSNASTDHLALLQEDDDIALMRQLGQFPRVIEASTVAHEPHRIAFYLYDLSAEFHSLWSRGKELPQLRFIHEGSQELTLARIALVAVTAQVIASGLEILGVNAIREMR